MNTIDRLNRILTGIEYEILRLNNIIDIHTIHIKSIGYDICFWIKINGDRLYVSTMCFYTSDDKIIKVKTGKEFAIYIPEKLNILDIFKFEAELLREEVKNERTMK